MENLLDKLSDMQIIDTDGDLVAEVIAVHYIGKQLCVTVVPFEEEDDGARDPIPEMHVPEVLSVITGGNGG